MKIMNSLSRLIASFKNDQASIAIETGIMLPILLFCGMGATELVMAYMHKNSLVDMGNSYSLILARKGGNTTEAMMKDLIEKSNTNSNQSDFFKRGRVIFTAVDMPKNAPKPVKLWQRCSGQPAGKNFVTQFPGAQITWPSSKAPLRQGATHILVEVYYDSQPLTGFYMTEKDASGHRINHLYDFKTNESLALINSQRYEFKAVPDNPEAIAKASSSCG